MSVHKNSKLKVTGLRNLTLFLRAGWSQTKERKIFNQSEGLLTQENQWRIENFHCLCEA